MNYYNEIKQELINNEVYKKVKDYSKNRSDLLTYYNVGKLLSKAGKKYGNGIIKEYSEKLKVEIGLFYTQRTLFRMRQFYLLFENEKVSTLSTQLTWSHYTELLKIADINKINYYIKIVEKQNLSVRQLREKIKNNEYERLDDKAKQKLIIHNDNDINDLIKHPVFIKNKYNKEHISEKMLQQLILEDLPNFLKELGNGFCFIDNEFPIKVGDRYNYIDLLLYNIIYKCYVVIELKITELKAEHIGQVLKYINYVDKNIKTISENNTIGIIICKKDNKFVIEYASDKRIFETTYELV